MGARRLDRIVLGALLLLDVVPLAVWSAVVSLAAVVLAALSAMRFGAAHHAENVGATSTGAFVLAAAGLLDGHRVMTHAAYGDRLRGLGVECVARPWVHDGRYLTAAGVSGAIGMTLHLIAPADGRGRSEKHSTGDRARPDPLFGGLTRDRTTHTPATARPTRPRPATEDVMATEHRCSSASRSCCTPG